MRGIYLRENGAKWQVEMMYKGERTYLGRFKTQKEALEMYNMASIYHKGWSPYLVPKTMCEDGVCYVGLYGRKGHEKTFIIDEADREEVDRHKWYLRKGGLIQIYIDGKSLALPRFLLKTDKHVKIKHIDDDRLNNTRENLEIDDSEPVDMTDKIEKKKAQNRQRLIRFREKNKDEINAKRREKYAAEKQAS